MKIRKQELNLSSYIEENELVQCVNCRRLMFAEDVIWVPYYEYLDELKTTKNKIFNMKLTCIYPLCKECNEIVWVSE